MKIEHLLPVLLLAGPLASIQAAPLAATTAVQTQADPSAPALTYLKAGAEPTPSTDPNAIAPAGWMAVDVPGPFQGYVLDQDLSKGLEVKPGSKIYFAPKDDAAVLAVTAPGDKTEITGLYGRWTQVELRKKLIGYIALAPEAAAPPPLPAPEPAASARAPGPVASSGPAATPAFFEGRFTPAHRLFGHSPYPWQLDDASSSRIAYLDVSKLMFTAQVQDYAGKQVAVYGAARPVPGTHDIVIVVESLQLK